MRASVSDSLPYFGRVAVSSDSADILFSPYGDSGSALRKSGIAVVPENVRITANVLTGTAPWDPSQVKNVAAVQVDDGGSVSLTARNTSGVLRGSLQVGTSGIYLRTVSGDDLDGGYLTLERSSGAVAMGRADADGTPNSYITFSDDAGDVEIVRNGFTRINSMADGVELRPYAYTSIIAGLNGGRLQIGADNGSTVFFYWSSGNIFLGSGGSMLFNFGAVSNLLGLNIANRLSSLEANQTTLFAIAHSH
jgi:hypothetical protein